MTLWEQADRTPDRPAYVMAPSGTSVSFAELEMRSRRIEAALTRAGLTPGDAVAVLMENNARYLEVYFGVVRNGRFIVPINRHATPDEVEHIVRDSGARVVVASSACAAAADLPSRLPGLLLFGVGADLPGYRSLGQALSEVGDPPYTGNMRGLPLYYSSGTTGRPKGIKRPLPGVPFEESRGFEEFLVDQYALTDQTVYLSTGPQYHSAPLTFPATVVDAGGTAIIMERFDARLALDLIDRYAVTTSQWVPTMFKRLLDIPEAERASFDLSSHQLALLSAAPCPPEIKEAMIEWWGPIIVEYYGATETYGMTACTSEEWLTHKGSVGRPVLGVPHICDASGQELPAGADGLIYFERDSDVFAYHNDPAKTAASRHPEHPFWRRVGDIGHLDEDGYLYLSDREAHMIISGGANIYPQEVEDALISCPEVEDAAVIGAPDPDLGEIVLAVVVLKTPDSRAASESEELLLEWLSTRIARTKLPRRFAFATSLPRLDNGKLYKHKLKATYAHEASV